MLDRVDRDGIRINIVPWLYARGILNRIVGDGSWFWTRTFQFYEEWRKEENWGERSSPRVGPKTEWGNLNFGIFIYGYSAWFSYSITQLLNYSMLKCGNMAELSHPEKQIRIQEMQEMQEIPLNPTKFNVMHHWSGLSWLYWWAFSTSSFTESQGNIEYRVPTKYSQLVDPLS